MRSSTESAIASPPGPTRGVSVSVKSGRVAWLALAGALLATGCAGPRVMVRAVWSARVTDQFSCRVTVVRDEGEDPDPFAGVTLVLVPDVPSETAFTNADAPVDRYEFPVNSAPFHISRTTGGYRTEGTVRVPTAAMITEHRTESVLGVPRRKTTLPAGTWRSPTYTASIEHPEGLTVAPRAKRVGGKEKQAVFRLQ